MWEIIRGLIASGVTIFLTTQYLEEADRLADDILVIDHGLVIAQGDARSLKRQVGGDNIGVTVSDAARLDEAAEILGRITGAEPALDRPVRTAVAPTRDGVASLGRVADALAQCGLGVEDLSLRQPTLDEVFLALTGHYTEATPEES